MVRREEEKVYGGKCEMKAKLKVTFLLRKIKTKSLSSTELNSDNELRYVPKKKIRATKSTAITTQHLSRCHRYLGSLLCLFRLVHLGIFISWWSSVLLLFSHIHLCIVSLSLSLRSRGLKTLSSLLISIFSFIMISTTPAVKSKQIFRQVFCIILMFRSK